MKKLLLAAVALVALAAGPAVAADLGRKAPAYIPPPAPPPPTFTGCYVDAGAGYGLNNIDHFSHPGTFNNNVLSMAAGVAGLRVLTAEALGDLNARGDALRNSLNEQFGRLDANLYATGLGSIMNLHVRAERHYARVARELLFFSLLARGFYIANRGLITLSLPVTDKMTSSFVSAIRDVIETHREVFCT